MTVEEYDGWSAHSRHGFAAQQFASGLVTGPHAEADALASARTVFADLLPDGRTTPTHHLWTVRAADHDDPVGWLWARVAADPEPPHLVEAYVFDVEVRDGLRGRGLGRAAMLALEPAVRDLGAVVIRLNVFGHNTAALRLYQSLGYVVTATTLGGLRVTARRMAKVLAGEGGPR